MKPSIQTLTLIALAVAVLVAGPVSAPTYAQDEAAGPAPKAVVDNPVSADVETTRGKKVDFEFEIRNEGTAPLELLEVRPACGCTVADYDKVIEPGGKGILRATLDTANLEAGGTAKGVTVFTNDPETPRIQLTLRVLVEELVIFNPGFARFVQTRGHSPGVIRQLLYAGDLDKLEIRGVESPFPYLEVTYRPADDTEKIQVSEHDQWVLTLEFDYSKAPVGPVIGEVKVHTNHPEQPVAQLPVSGFVRPVVAVTPDRADFGQLTLSEPLVVSFRIKNFGPEALSITEVVSGLEGMEASVRELKPGRDFAVDLTLDPKMKKGSFDASLKIRTSSKVAPLVEVPLHGEVL